MISHLFFYLLVICVVANSVHMSYQMEILAAAFPPPPSVLKNRVIEKEGDREGVTDVQEENGVRASVNITQIN